MMCFILNYFASYMLCHNFLKPESWGTNSRERSKQCNTNWHFSTNWHWNTNWKMAYLVKSVPQKGNEWTSELQNSHKKVATCIWSQGMGEVPKSQPKAWAPLSEPKPLQYIGWRVIREDLRFSLGLHTWSYLHMHPCLAMHTCVHTHIKQTNKQNP